MTYKPSGDTFLIAFITGIAYAAYQPIPTREDGISRKTITVADTTIDKLNEIIVQLKIHNKYMELISGEEITINDIE